MPTVRSKGFPGKCFVGMSSSFTTETYAQFPLFHPIPFCRLICSWQDYENRKRRAGHLPRSRSPARSCYTRKYHPSTSSPAFFAEAPHDMVASTRGWSLHKQRSRASTGTTNTEPSVDQIDPYAYVKSRRAARDALPHSSTTDEYDYYLHGRYEREWEQHQADVRAYNDPRWGYYM